MDRRGGPLSGARAAVRGVAERLLGACPSRAPKSGRLVLAYHNVVPDGTAVAGDASLHVPRSAFAAQMRLLRQEADVVPLMELLASPAPRNRLVAVTFDDAYASSLLEGLPCCAAEGIPVTVFVAPGLLGAIPPWDRRAAEARWSAAERSAFLSQARGMDLDDARTFHPDHAMREGLEPCRIATEAAVLAAAGADARVTLGNHTMRHANLGALDTASARAEVEETAAWLAARAADVSVPVLAYPFGLPPSDPAGALAGSGVTHALCVEGGWMSPRAPVSPWRVPRWNVSAGVSPRGFRVRLRGWLADRPSE